MGITNIRFISERGLANLAHYSYTGVDNSFFGNLVLKHFWNWVVQLLPMWLAPNLLTLAGLMCNIAMCVLMAYYSPHVREQAPRWAYVLVAFLIFAYQTLDNVDGKQARRTKSSSPLGELFDHVCDGLSVSMFGLVMAATLQLGPTGGLVSALIGFWPFYAAHWEEYHAGILILGMFNGPTEAQLLFMVICLLTAGAGPDLWLKQPFFGLTLGQLMLIFSALTAAATLFQNGYNVWKLPSRKLSYHLTLLQFSPLAVFTCVSVIYAAAAPELLAAQPQLMVSAMGVLYAYLVARLIVQRVCHEEIQRFYWISLPYAAVALNSVLARLSNTFVNEEQLCWALLIGGTVLFLTLALVVIDQLTTHLHIHVFRIVQAPSVAQQSNNTQEQVALLELSPTETNSDPSKNV